MQIIYPNHFIENFTKDYVVATSILLALVGTGIFLCYSISYLIIPHAPEFCYILVISYSIVRMIDGTVVKKYKHPAPVYGCDWSPNNRYILAFTYYRRKLVTSTCMNTFYDQYESFFVDLTLNRANTLDTVLDKSIYI